MKLLNKFPKLKVLLKKIVLLVNIIKSKEEKSTNNVEIISPIDDDFEYFFGYYDKSVWNSDESYMVFLKARNTTSSPAPQEPADIILFDTINKKYKKIAETRAWNVQQGCMLQWLGPDFYNKLIYNDFRNNKLCSVILKINFDNLCVDEIKVFDLPIYDVSKNGKYALSLDFLRLNSFRPGYGYGNLEDKTKNMKVPHGFAISKINLYTGKITGLLKYKDLIQINPKGNMIDAYHKVNHIMINPDGSRFMVLHRWIKDGSKFTRLLTFDNSGKNVCVLSDDDMVSHCFWKNDNEILAFENKKEQGNGYYLMKDKTGKYKQLWQDIKDDGHPSYSPNKKMIITDSYPNNNRISEIRLLNNDGVSYEVIAKVFSPLKYYGDVRCDLHPRWNRNSTKICFDSTHLGKRSVCVINIERCDDDE